MHLKTLTLRGFKSFASATTLRFEPGVTCVVGPNGSGKSNVVDALSWVMGEQGAKSLRGGKMEDVIFAGTAGRAPLGRAEVSLTIDNTDGALPIDYTEVTISRTLFRNGGSEYAINGSSCRLLDIQDLLSDSGIGREMHVIVGQGQLDAVLRATPEERRGFIEEAAGVLKHRKRKEKALRKLDAMQGNLTRLGDLTTEIRRQLGPLGRQAEVARKAQVIQIDLRDSRARLLADDLAQLTAALEQELADESALRAQQAEAEQRLGGARERLARLEQEAALAAPELSRASDAWYRLSQVRERIRSTQTLAGERLRHLGTVEPARAGQDPDELARQAERARAHEAELTADVDQARLALEGRVAARTEAEAVHGRAERELATLHRGAADRREGLARLAGQVAAKRSRVEATDAEIGRLQEVVADAERRAAAARQDFAALETQVVGAEEGEVGLDAEHEAALEALESATAEVDALRAEADTAGRDRATWSARVEALEMSLTRKDGGGALLASDVVGTVGSVAALVGIEPGFEDAVAAALGTSADAVAVESLEAAVDALRHLRAQDAGRAGIVVLDAAGPAPSDAGAAPAGTRWIADVVTAAPAARAAVERLLHGVVVVDDLAQARGVVQARPDVVAVTRGGDVLGALEVRGGSASAPGVLHLQAALDEAKDALADAVARGERTTFALVGADERAAEARARHDETLERLDENDAALAAVAERLGGLGAAARSAGAEAERARANLERATAGLATEQADLAALVERLDVAQAEPEQSDDAVERATAARDEGAQAAQAARAAEMEARLALRTAEERARALAGRAQSLDRAAANERAAREQAARREAARAVRAARASAVHDAAERVLVQLEASIADAADAKAAAETARAERDQQVGAARTAVDELATVLRELTDVAHRDEVARAQQQMRVDQLRARSVDELGIDPTVLVDEFGPHRGVPLTGDDATDEEGTPREVPYVRAEQEKRLRTAERGLRTLGKVNPLALEEFAALEERHTFLTTQLADLKKSRQDLLEIVREIDERVEQVFTSAFEDTAAQFVRVFARMFPGGEGRLVLTDPSNMLTTGIEVEARPAGKKVKRLSLLSGGERSLTAVAILVSIFKARPSPFYVMDEVEAALDDVNLGRLLEIFRELQEDSQLIVITHQKRTMEVADALYGVTMRGDGVTTVISQRMDERQPA
ncbi:condensin subunit Smc [Sediminihabitans luteus]|uniref:Chromosome partition protein Smc n=1 Tax=Sediminihabitans luteus TaxID=1138585 RepID=A0A2M9CCB6_9CELL|nr:chromosome segregation protein SMC [Sediminihabitans luteus]PJJ68976.1 condensin subunit Smc [Sediminihabitans luteus]GII99359.1 chromosome partition protein Smc [Sediminihabitans luteus]